jgi:hypothetical protein
MLRVVRVSVVLAVVVAAGVAGVMIWAGLSARADAFEESRASTQRWAQLQADRAHLVSADLAGAGEVSRLGSGRLPAASAGAAATDLTVARYAPAYGEQVQHARTVAAAGDPSVALNLMLQASDRLRAEVLPQLEQRQDTGPRSQPAGLLIPLLVVGLVAAGLAGVYGFQAFRTRRALKAVLASAAILLLLVMVPAVGSVRGGLRAARDVRAGPQPAAARLAEGRNAAFDARSIEVRAVVRNADLGVSVQADWQAALDRAESSLPPAALDGYRKAHQRVLVAARTEFGYTVAERVLTRADGTAGAFDRFDVVTGAALEREVRVTDDGWAAALRHLRLIAWASLAAGLVTAVLALPLARSEFSRSGLRR